MLRKCSAFILPLLLAASLSGPVGAMTLVGTARVVDGDTLELTGEHIRLIGVDAPEIAQTCERGGAVWACGDWARDELTARVRGRDIECTGNERDRYGRLLATCRIGEADLGQALVRDGVAMAYRRYSMDYVPDEGRAKAARRGLWAGSVERPEDYRQAGETAVAAADPSAPGGCAIKGNISGSGQIYHVPGQHDYAATRISPAKGERWFCSAAEAEAAGWRAARR